MTSGQREIIMQAIIGKELVTMRTATVCNSMMMEMYMCGMCKMMRAQKSDSPCVLSV